MCATSTQASCFHQLIWFDTDSFLSTLDNCATYFLTSHQADFVGTLQHSNITVKDIAGASTGKWTGTVKWPITDDQGLMHELLIPNTVLIPKGSLPFCQLLPQHLAKENLAQEPYASHQVMTRLSTSIKTNLKFKCLHSMKTKTMSPNWTIQLTNYYFTTTDWPTNHSKTFSKSPKLASCQANLQPAKSLNAHYGKASKIPWHSKGKPKAVNCSKPPWLVRSFPSTNSNQWSLVMLGKSKAGPQCYDTMSPPFLLIISADWVLFTFKSLTLEKKS